LREASLFHAQGRLDQAERGFQFILGLDARNFEALYRLGLIRIQQGRFGDAADFLRRALKIERRSPDAHHYLGFALSGLGRHDEAVARYEKALALKPDLVEAHNNLAHSLQALGRNEEAISCYERALTLKPDYPEASNNLGTILESLGRTDEAVQHYEAALAQRPGYVEAHKNLGRLLGSLGREDEGARHYEEVLALRPADLDANLALGDLLQTLDRPDAATAQYERALALNDRCIAARIGLGNVAHESGRSEDALAHYRKALSLDPGAVEAHGRLGNALQALGRMDEARQALERAVELAPRGAGYFWNLAVSRRAAAGDRHLEAMQRLPARVDRLTPMEQIDLHFALGKVLEDMGEHARSFEHIVRGNALMRRRVAYDEARALGRLERIRATFATDLLREKAGLGEPSPAPVFIVGLPRSGTTLIEQILASHPKVFGAGELRTMAGLAERIRGADGLAFPEAVSTLSAVELRRVGLDYLRAVRRLASSAERICDKMPGNFALVGLIRLVLPNAHIIHACRDVRDTALSCFSLLFSRGQTYSYDLAELGRHCAAYQRLMGHWHEVMPGAILDVRYEDVVADLESQARRIVAHCGLEWNDACLAFHRTERSVRTASAVQVRQPIYRSSVGRWRAHEQALEPLLRALEHGTGG
jgi:tetratricopeptide (TPR) repeat protein